MRLPSLPILQGCYSAGIKTRGLLLCLLLVTIGGIQPVTASDAGAQAHIVVLEKEHRERVKRDTSKQFIQPNTDAQIDDIYALIAHHRYRVVELQNLDNEQRKNYLLLDGLSQLRHFIVFTSHRLDYLRQVMQHYVAIGSLQGRLINLVGGAKGSKGGSLSVRAVPPSVSTGHLVSTL